MRHHRTPTAPRLAWSWLVATVLALVVAGLGSAHPGDFPGPLWELKGTWSITSTAPGVAPHQWLLTTSLPGDAHQVDGSGTLDGENLAVGATGWTPSGVTQVSVTEKVDGALLRTYEGTMSDASTMSGDVKDTAAVVVGTWTAKRVADAAGAPTPVTPATPATTGTRTVGIGVVCQRPANPFAFAPCTVSARSGGAAGAPGVTPTGVVTWTAGDGALQGTACALAAVPSSPGMAACTVQYRRALGAAAGAAFPVTVSYAGDATFAPAAGRHRTAPVACIGTAASTASAKAVVPADLGIARPPADRRGEPTVLPRVAVSPLAACADGFQLRVVASARGTGLDTDAACAPGSPPATVPGPTGQCIATITAYTPARPLMARATRTTVTYDRRARRSRVAAADAKGRTTTVVADSGAPSAPTAADGARMEKLAIDERWVVIANATSAARRPATLGRAATVSLGRRTVIMAPGTAARLRVSLSPQGRKVVALYRAAGARTMPLYVSVDVYDAGTRALSRVTKRVSVRVR